MAKSFSGTNVLAQQAAGAKRARAARHNIALGLRYAILIVGAIVLMIPFAWQLSTSLKDDQQINAVPGSFLPNPAHLDSYVQAYTILPFNIFFKNTVLIEIGVMSGVLITSTMVAYAFARLQAPFKDTLFIIVLSTMMLPFIITLVPTYFIWVHLHLADTLWPLIIPSWFGGGAFNIFLLRQFFLTIPGELGEAATIDGAGILTVMVRIFVPLAQPAIAAIAILTFIGTWHDFLGPLIYLNSEHNFTLALGINEFISQQRGAVNHWGWVMAASMSIIVPPLVLFIVFQRFFVEGITLGGIKG